MPLPSVVGLGELLWDVFSDGKRPGGAPANVAFQAGQLGCRGIVASRVGADPEGDEILEFLQRQGIDVTAIQRDRQYPTGRVTVTLSPQGQPSYVIHEEVAWDFLECNELLCTVMAEAAAVCFGTLAQRSDVSRRAIHEAVRATRGECLRVYDVNLRQQYYQTEWIEASLGLADIVKLNDDEVALLAPLLEVPVDHVEFSRAVMANWGPRMVCVTRGASGCLVVEADSVHSIAGRMVKVADTVGAGDAFTAALIVAQLQGWSVERSADFANYVGGLVASHHGAMPDLGGTQRVIDDWEAEAL